MPDYTQWEYKVTTFGSSWGLTKDEPIEDSLNELGEEGWEIVAAVALYGKMRVIAKRPLIQQSRRRRHSPLPEV